MHSSTTMTVMALGAMLAGCGGSFKTEVSSGGGGGASGGGDNGESESTFIEPEIFDQTQRVFTRKRPQIENCYARAVDDGKLSRKVGGRVVVDAHIAKSGKAEIVRISDNSTLKNENMSTCIVKEIKSWNLPEPNVAFDFSFAYDFLSE